MRRHAIKHWWQREHAFSSAAMTIMLLPVIFGIFGLGFEVARATYMKIWIQSRVDNATFTATTFSTVDASGRFTFKPNARQEAYSNYQANTAEKRSNGLFSCTSAQVANGATSGQCYGRACWVYDGVRTCSGAPSPLPKGQNVCNFEYGISYTVRESMPTSFLRLVGVTSIDLPQVTGTSLVKTRSC